MQQNQRRESQRKERQKPRQPAILQAASQLFLQHGYDGTSTEMIAEKAGVSRQTIYNQFENKQALFVAIAADLIREIVAPLAEAVERGDDLRQTLIACGRGLLDTMLSPKTIALYRLIVTEVPRFPGLGRAILEAGPEQAERAVAAYLSGHKQLDIHDQTIAARQFLALVGHRFELKAQLVPVEASSPEIEQHLNAAVDTFLRAYSRK